MNKVQNIFIVVTNLQCNKYLKLKPIQIHRYSIGEKIPRSKHK